MHIVKQPRITLERTIRLVLGLYGVVLGVLLSILASSTNLIADDYRLLRAGFPTLSYIYNHDSGRVSHGIVLSASKALFGEKAVHIFPILVIIIFITSVCLLVFTVTRNKGSLLYGSAFALLFICSIHSLYDFAFFFSAATAHTLTLSYLIGVAALLVYVRGQGPLRERRLYIAAAGFCLWGGMLSELAAVLSCIIVVACMAYDAASLPDGSLFRRIVRSFRPVYLYIAIANIVGFLVIFLSPGSAHRRAANMGGTPLGQVLERALSDFAAMVQHYTTPAGALALLSITLVFVVLMRQARIIQARSIVIAATVSLCAPLVIFATTNQSLGYTALRMFNIADFFFVTGVALLAAYVFAQYMKDVRVVYAALCPLVLASLALFAAHDFRAIHTAETKRAALLAQRQAIIAHDLHTKGTKTVRFLPAPLLLTDTEAIDTTFYPSASPQSLWLYPELLRYYHIPTTAKVRLLEQPNGYCIASDVQSRFKEVLAKACGTFQPAKELRNYSL